MAWAMVKSSYIPDSTGSSDADKNKEYDILGSSGVSHYKASGG